jgi:hypothetical protein
MAPPDSHPDTEALAEQVVEELDPGQIIDNKVILSRRQLLAIAGSGLGAGALAALGVDEAAAQTGPAGQQGTSSEPNDMYAWDLNVANQVTSNLPMGGNDLTDVGAASIGSLSTEEIANGLDVFADVTLVDNGTATIGNNSTAILVNDHQKSAASNIIHAVINPDPDSSDDFRFGLAFTGDVELLYRGQGNGTTDIAARNESGAETDVIWAVWEIAP